MDSFSSHKTDPKAKKEQHHQPSNSELFSSAKLVAEAAKASLSNESDKVDKGRVASAAEDLLGAASRYGKLEEKSYGKYVDKAENYLHQYHSSHTTTTTTTGSGHKTTTETHTETESHSGGQSDGGHGKSEGGYGDYLKMAQGFLKK